MALPGSRGPSKTQLVVDLTSAYDKLNFSLEKTEKLSKSIADNLKVLGTGPSGLNIPTSGSKSAGNSMNFGFQNVSGNSGKDDNSSNSMGFAKALGKFGLGSLVAGGTAAMQMVQPEKFVENQILRTRFDFFAGQQGAGSMSFQNMMRQGTGTSDMDAARAAGMAMSMGMMPTANKNGLFNTYSGSAATLSNMVPGAGLEGGMSAVNSLNQAASVNKLRMIGIQVRNSATGMMNSYSDIAGQLWEVIKRAHTGGGAITADELSLSLQPGNSLASLLDQYFSGDPVLRQGIVTELYKRAGGLNGYSKSKLQAMGILPAVANSMGKTNAALYGAVNAYTDVGTKGVMDANTVIANAAKMFADNVDKFGGIVQAMSAAQTLAGSGGGAGGTILGFLSQAVSSAVGSAVGNAFGKLMGSKAGGFLGKAGNVLGKVGRFAGKFGGPLIAGALGVSNLIGDVNSGHGFGSKKFSHDAGSTAGGLIGGTLGALVPIPGLDIVTSMAGAAAGSWLGGMLGDSMGTGGEGVGGDGVNGGVFAPLKGGLSTPTNGEFGNNAPFRRQPHRGVDFRAKTGTPVYSIKGGQVVKAGQEGDLGNMIRIDHGDGTKTLYGHLSGQAVHAGDVVNAGDPIGLSGFSGGVYPAGPAGAHLHVGLETGSGMMDPMSILGGSAAPTANGIYNSVSPLFGGSSTPLFSNTSTSLFSSGASSGSGVGGESMSGGGVSYGGVTVHINVPKGAALDEHKLAREVKRILQDEEQIRMAVIR